MSKKIVRFVGIDSWGRPVFKQDDARNFYGATDILFSDEADGDEVLKTLTEADLTYFGSRFGCEPMGSPCDDIRIELGGQRRVI
jgi:hypothetical protein